MVEVAVLGEAIIVGFIVSFLGSWIPNLFILGFLTHVICEVTGINKLYCRTGNACKPVKSALRSNETPTQKPRSVSFSDSPTNVTASGEILQKISSIPYVGPTLSSVTEIGMAIGTALTPDGLI